MSTTVEAAVPVVVAGGGPVGVAAALMLARRGVPTLVVEKREEIYPLPRAVHLDDEVHRILQDVGVSEAFSRVTMPILGLRLLDAEHRTMAEFGRSTAVGEHGYPQANMFDQPVLEQILRDALAAHPLASLASGTELVDFRSEPGPQDGTVVVRLRDVGSGAEREVRTSALLGCDGANSRVRDIAGATLEDLGFEERWLVVDVRSQTPLGVWQGVHQLCDPRRAATFMPVVPGRYRWEFRLHDNEVATDLVESGQLADLIRPWLGDVPFERLELVRHAEYTFKARVADRWRAGRVFLLGDAAHLTPPFIGQGLCAGLRDAANLTWKLAAVVRGGADEALLDSYEAERGPHARALVQKAVRVGWAMTGGQDGAAHVRRAMLGVACRIPGATTNVLDARPPRFRAGIAVEHASWRDRTVGRPAPQPVVTVDGHRRRLDEVTGDGHAVLVVGPPDPRLVSACRDLGASLVRVVAAPSAGEHPWYTLAVDKEGHLLGWMRRARAVAVLLRPDHVVQDSEPLMATRHGAGGQLAAR
ncbi:MAG: bifunctional 3-(3-hydroxy-phenyl)propionate/3-hydroxycinnamic acid hydroxylase, partial [Actinomycetes bacterium]